MDTRAALVLQNRLVVHERALELAHLFVQLCVLQREALVVGQDVGEGCAEVLAALGPAHHRRRRSIPRNSPGLPRWLHERRRQERQSPGVHRWAWRHHGRGGGGGVQPGHTALLFLILTLLKGRRIRCRLGSARVERAGGVAARWRGVWTREHRRLKPRARCVLGMRLLRRWRVRVQCATPPSRHDCGALRLPFVQRSRGCPLAFRLARKAHRCGVAQHQTSTCALTKPGAPWTLPHEVLARQPRRFNPACAVEARVPVRFALRAREVDERLPVSAFPQRSSAPVTRA
mmetsp:Transcript_29991/g.97636  ORF Transcript_29991/g.97636 Transcript_29991/m.97636 type:complete len:288 (+) Transcript_29991:1869-2732(+)